MSMSDHEFVMGLGEHFCAAHLRGRYCGQPKADHVARPLSDPTETLALIAERKAAEAIREDFRKCYDLATIAASYWPDSAEVWTGTVSERLHRLFTLEHEAREAAEMELARIRGQQ